MSDCPLSLGITYAHLACWGRCGQSISPCTVELMLVPSGSVTHSGCTFELMCLIGALMVKKFPVASKSKIAVFSPEFPFQLIAAAFLVSQKFALLA